MTKLTLGDLIAFTIVLALLASFIALGILAAHAQVWSVYK